MEMLLNTELSLMLYKNIESFMAENEVLKEKNVL
jgi:hypothetical protein